MAVGLDDLHRDAARLAVEEELHAGQAALELADPGHRADGVEHLGGDRLYIFALGHREHQAARRIECGFDRLQGGGLAGVDRRRDARQEHEVPQRQDGKCHSLAHHARPTGAHRAVLAFAWGIWCTGFYSLMLLSFVLQPIQDELGLSEANLATLTAVGVGMTGVGGLFFGWMSDRLGRRLSMMVSIAAFSLGNAACALAPGGLAARRAGARRPGRRWLVGRRAGDAGGDHAAPSPRTVWRHRADRRAGRHGARGDRRLLPGAGGRLADGLPALGAPILALLAWRWLPESDLWLEHRRQRGAAAATSTRRPILAQLVAPDLAGIFGRAFVLALFNMSAYWFAVVWLPRYLQKQRGLTIFGSGWWTLTFVAGSFLGYLTFGWVSDAAGRRRAFALYCAVTAGPRHGDPVLGRLRGPSRARPRLHVRRRRGDGDLVLLRPVLLGALPDPRRGAAMSIIMNVTRGVQFVAPLAIAAVAGRWGLAGGVALAAGFALLAGAWVWTLPETAGRGLT